MRNRKGRSYGASRGNLGDAPRKPRRLFSDHKRARPRIRPQEYSAYEQEPATQEYMARLFEAHAFPVTPAELDRFWEYYLLLREKNTECDLTRILGLEATVLKHFIDCAVIAPMVEWVEPVLDVGSGAGFPGVPLAIRRPDLQVILAESRRKRVHFLELLCQRLRLENVTLYPHSVREDTELVVGTVVTRALETIPLTLQRVASVVRPQGKVVFLKGPNCGQEVTEAQQQFKGIYKMIDDIHYTLGNTNQRRRLVVFVKR